MSCRPLSALIISALALAACDGGATDPATPSPVAPPEDRAQTSPPARPDAVEATSPADPGSTTAAGSADGQAVADRTMAFMLAVVTADPQFCQLVVGLNGDAPLADSPDQLALCEQELIPQLAADVDEQDAAIIKAIQIEGASIEGDTARVSADNFGGSFAEGLGAADIVLQQFEGQWYVDLDQSNFGG